MGSPNDGALADRELTSWKEIATYLGVSTRTAQLWERDRGLPVRRLPGGRGLVYASVSELDDWKRSATSSSSVPDVPTAAVIPPVNGVPALRRSGRIGLLVAALVMVLLAAMVGMHFFRTVDPVSYRTERRSLVVLDAEGRTLWHKVFPYDLAEAVTPNTELARAWVGDLDGDGHAEVLFYPRRTENVGESVPLICYSASGRERWRFVPSRRVSTRTTAFEPLYVVYAFLVGPTRRGGPLRVVVAAEHYLHAPSEIALLDTDGHVQHEYWHYGQLNRIAMADLDGKGTKIYAAGISNAWNAATLVVLDPETFDGVAQEAEHPDLQLLGFPPAREVARIILPRTCLNRERHNYNGVGRIYAHDGTITVETQEIFGITGPMGSVFHRFNSVFTKHDVAISDGYTTEYAKIPPALRHCTLDDPELHKVRVITPIHDGQ